MFEWLKRWFAGSRPKAAPGTITRTCRMCGRTFTLPEEVQAWPDCCPACRAKYQPVETLTGTCRRCGKKFTFASSDKPWPKYCQECRAGRRGNKQ